jgi:hypothetical protein
MTRSKFYSTPQPLTLCPAVTKSQLSGKELLYKLEDDYSEYRHSCNLGLCKSDPAVHEKFKEAIAKATKEL